MSFSPTPGYYEPPDEPDIHSDETDDYCRCNEPLDRKHIHYTRSREESDAWLECWAGHRQSEKQFKLQAGER